MTVNQKGDIGIVETIRDLAKNQITTFLPISDKTVIDLVAVNETGITKRIQVKYREMRKGGVCLSLYSVVNGKKIPIDLSMLDGFAIYCPEKETVLYVDKSDIDPKHRSMTLRFDEPKRKGTARHHLAREYTDCRRIWRSLSGSNG